MGGRPLTLSRGELGSILFGDPRAPSDRHPTAIRPPSDRHPTACLCSDCAPLAALQATTILPGFDEAAAVYTRAWLGERGVELMGGEPIEKIEAESVLLKSGVKLEADVVYKCVGVMPNTAMLKESPFAAHFGFRDSIEVNDYLQVAGHPHVYCVGDAMSHKSRELKLGHTAEVNAHLAAHNILNSIHAKPLLRYPNGVTGADTTPKIWCLSLGRYAACLGFNGLVCTGWWVAVVKWMLEWTKVAAAAEKPVGILFWRVSDGVSNWLGRTLLRIPKDDEPPPSDPFEQLYRLPHPMLDFLLSPVWGQLGMWLMRVITGLLILHHGIGKLEDPDTFSTKVVAVYFPFLPGSPYFWTYASAMFEIVGSGCIAFGIFVRPVRNTARDSDPRRAADSRHPSPPSPFLHPLEGHECHPHAAQAAFLLAATMVNAIYFHLRAFGLQNFPLDPDSGGSYTFEPSMAFLGITLCKPHAHVEPSQPHTRPPPPPLPHTPTHPPTPLPHARPKICGL